MVPEKERAARALRILRARDGVSAISVARATGLGYSTVNNCERAVNYPSRRTAAKLADYYGVPVEVVYGFSPVPAERSGRCE